MSRRRTTTDRELRAARNRRTTTGVEVTRWEPATTLPPALTWESQVVQYPATGPMGISYFAGPTDYGDVDCLLFRNQAGEVVGILNHYPFDAPPWEKKGNVNIWVHPDYQRGGIATALFVEAVRRWNVTLRQQRFTQQGAALARVLRDKGYR